MKIFKVPELLAAKYHGSGYAMAASVNGVLVDIVYLTDVLPEFEALSANAGKEWAAVLSDARLAPTVRRLQALGLVHMGMLSRWEFVEL